LLWAGLIRTGITRPIPPFRHELIELGLVLRHAQAIEEATELALFLLETAQGLLAIFVERAIAGGRINASVQAPLLSLALPALSHPALPARKVTVPSTAHPSAPDQVSQNCESYRPEHREAEDHDGDPGRLSPVVKAFDHLRHCFHPHVNVIYINIPAV